MEYQKVSALVDRCKKEISGLPENPYVVMNEVTNALMATNGKESEAMRKLKDKFSGKKRMHDEPQHNGNDDTESEGGTQHKRVKLAEEIGERPANVRANQKIVDAFVEYGLSQLDKGHTGKGTTHLRAAREIRDFDKPIKSGKDARQVGYVGALMAMQVEQVLKQGSIIDDEPDMNVSKNYDENEPNIVHDIRDKPAKCKENQDLVDALTDFGEYHLKYGNTGKGTSHLRAAKELHNTETVIESGLHARSVVGYIGDVIADKIDQIREHGKIVEDADNSGDSSNQRVRGDPAPIVQDLLLHPAKRKENQRVVDALCDYGDAHLSSGGRGTGISHLRAAKEIRNSDVVIKRAADAKQIGMVGNKVARKIDQILKHGHADSDDDYVPEEEEDEEEEEENEEEYGPREEPTSETPLMRDIASQKAQRAENQKIVDALMEFGSKQLKENHTGRGVTFLRAARQLRDSHEVIKSGVQAMKIGMIGGKVGDFIEQVLEGKTEFD